MAIGQLYDYRRHVPEVVELAGLFPKKPRPDLLDLLSSACISCIWESSKGSFEEMAPFTQ